MTAPNPIGWDAQRIRYLFSERNEKGYPDAEPLAATQHAGVVPKNQLDFKTMEAVTSDLSLFKLVEPGDFVISLRSFEGGIEHSAHRGILSPAYTVLRPSGKVHPGFFKHLLKSDWFVQGLSRHKKGIRDGQAVPFGTLQDDYLYVPALSAQERIANFLDEQTARIDALIAEKEKLIDRFAEFRYSTISWAVAGGLHSGRGTFKTGNVFVPNLPIGWSLGGLTKYIGPVVDYRGKTPEKVPEGVLLVTARNVRDGKLDYEVSAEYVRPEEYGEIMRRGLPKVGDVLFTTEAPLGQVANVDREDIALAQRIVKFRGLDGVIDNYFLKYWLMGDAVQSTLDTLATGSTAEGIKASKLGQIPIAVPTPGAQMEIVEYLDKKTDAIDATLAHVHEHISRLREYRSSLISAAVSGQLDINTFQARAA